MKNCNPLAYRSLKNNSTNYNFGVRNISAAQLYFLCHVWKCQSSCSTSSAVLSVGGPLLCVCVCVGMINESNKYKRESIKKNTHVGWKVIDLQSWVLLKPELLLESVNSCRRIDLFTAGGPTFGDGWIIFQQRWRWVGGRVCVFVFLVARGVV